VWGKVWKGGEKRVSGWGREGGQEETGGKNSNIKTKMRGGELTFRGLSKDRVVGLYGGGNAKKGHEKKKVGILQEGGC